MRDSDGDATASSRRPRVQVRAEEREHHRFKRVRWPQGTCAGVPADESSRFAITSEGCCTRSRSGARARPRRAPRARATVVAPEVAVALGLVPIAPGIVGVGLGVVLAALRKSYLRPPDARREECGDSKGFHSVWEVELKTHACCTRARIDPVLDLRIQQRGQTTSVAPVVTS
jgi:hypothetical protein